MLLHTATTDYTHKQFKRESSDWFFHLCPEQGKNHSDIFIRYHCPHIRFQ